MTTEMTVLVHDVDTDGLPDMEVMTGRVVFLFDGCLVSGWPLRGRLDGDGRTCWEANCDVGRNVVFHGVRHWIELPVPEWRIGSGPAPPGGEPALTKSG